MNPYFVDKYFKENTYDISMSDSFYKAVSSYVCPNEPLSYHWLTMRLFNLKAYDFYHYISYKYHAKIEVSSGFCISIYFENKDDAQMYCDELNKRFNYYFSEELKNE